MDNLISVSAQEPVNVLGGLWKTCILQFCNLPQYFTREAKVFKRKLLGMASFLAYFKISNSIDKSWGRGYGHSSNPDPWHYWEPFLASQKCLSLDQNYSVGCVDATSWKLPLLKRWCWAEWAILFCLFLQASCYNCQVTCRERFRLLAFLKEDTEKKLLMKG